MRNLLAVVCAILLICSVGCSVVDKRLEDGYQFGDIAGSGVDVMGLILQRQQAYCSGSAPESRALLLAFARSLKPGFPENGICTDLFSLLIKQ